jgi:hypothetical protein
MPECVQHTSSYNQKRDGPADFPEPPFVFIVADSFEAHAKVTGEEREGKEYDGDDGEYKNGLVLAVSNDSQLVLLDGSDLEQLDDT